MGLSIKKNGIILGSAVSGVINENMTLNQPTSYTPMDYRGYVIALPTNMVVGNTYTLQLWDVDLSHSGKTSSELYVSFFWNGGMNCEANFYIPSGHSDYFCRTFVAHNRGAADQTGPTFWVYNSPQYADGTRYMHIGKWKLEAGSIATPFSYAPTDANYTGNHVFTEDTNIPTKFGNGYVSGKEFIEI